MTADPGRTWLHCEIVEKIGEGEMGVVRKARLSGSPVIDSQGYVIGLMSAKSGDLQRLAPVDYARAVLARGVTDSSSIEELIGRTPGD